MELLFLLAVVAALFYGVFVAIRGVFRSAATSVGGVIGARIKDADEKRAQVLRNAGYPETYVAQDKKARGWQRGAALGNVSIGVIIAVIIVVLIFPPSSIFLLFYIVYAAVRGIMETRKTVKKAEQAAYYAKHPERAGPDYVGPTVTYNCPR